MRFHTSSKHEVKMMRQPSYRNIPTASDFEYKDEESESESGGGGKIGGGEEVPSLETSLDLDSYFEDEVKSTCCSSSDVGGEEVGRVSGGGGGGVYNNYRMGSSDKNRGTTIINAAETAEAEKGQVKSITKGTYDYEGPLEENNFQTEGIDVGVGMSLIDHCNDNDNDNDNDDDISYDSVEYDGSQGAYNDGVNDYEEEEEVNLYTSGHSNISTVIDDFVKDDYFSDSSEEETFFIEEKDRDYNGYTRRSIMGHFKSYSEPVLMLTRNLSLHTIDEEGSNFNDECSMTSFEISRQKDTTSTTKNTISQSSAKLFSMKRHRSAPTSSDSQRIDNDNNNNNNNNNPLQNIYDLEQQQHGDRGLSLELLRCFSVDTHNLSSGASESNVNSSAGDIESQSQETIHERGGGGLTSSSMRRRTLWASYKERLKTSRSCKIGLLATVSLLLLTACIVVLIAQLSMGRGR
mmetsp:Transcript_5206/g.7699  ORF Transcript_5206/g.7699 Transcript_5206/m.7699 type:complete len:462 (+) Transcript_5206:346-1731(+)